MDDGLGKSITHGTRELEFIAACARKNPVGRMQALLACLPLLANCLFDFFSYVAPAITGQQSQPSRRATVMLAAAPALTLGYGDSQKPKMVSRLSESCQPSVCCFRTCRHCPMWVLRLRRCNARVRCVRCVRMSPRGIDFNVQGVSVEGPPGSMDGGAEGRLPTADYWKFTRAEDSIILWRGSITRWCENS